MATSAAGITRGGNRTFTTVAGADRRRRSRPRRSGPIWGSGLTITGTVSGVGSTPVALEKQDFPFTGPYVADRDGDRERAAARSRCTVPPLFATTRLRVVTRTAVVATSPVTTASVAVKVGLKTKRLSRQRDSPGGRNLAGRAERPGVASAPVAQRPLGPRSEDNRVPAPRRPLALPVHGPAAGAAR